MESTEKPAQKKARPDIKVNNPTCGGTVDFKGDAAATIPFNGSCTPNVGYMVCQIDDNDLFQLNVTPGSGSATWDGGLTSDLFGGQNGDYLLTITALNDNGSSDSTTCFVTVTGIP